MMKWMLRRAITKFELDWNYDASYLRDMIDVSPRAAWLFSRVTALGRFRRDVPIAAWSAAGITAVRHEDCGPCTQLAVTMAERAGVSPDVLRAVLGDQPSAMPPEVGLVWRFTRATLAHDPLAPMSIAKRSWTCGAAARWSAWHSPSPPRASIPRSSTRLATARPACASSLAARRCTSITDACRNRSMRWCARRELHERI